jgi:hypothetical protein
VRTCATYEVVARVIADDERVEVFWLRGITTDQSSGPLLMRILT